MNALESNWTRLVRRITGALFVALVPVAVLGTTGTAAAAQLLEAWLCDCGSSLASAAETSEDSCCIAPELEAPTLPSDESCGEGAGGCCCSTPAERDTLPPTRALPEGSQGERDEAVELRRDLERSDATPSAEPSDWSQAQGPPARLCRPPDPASSGRATRPRMLLGSKERLALLCTSRT